MREHRVTEVLTNRRGLGACVREHRVTEVLTNRRGFGACVREHRVTEVLTNRRGLQLGACVREHRVTEVLTIGSLRYTNRRGLGAYVREHRVTEVLTNRQGLGACVCVYMWSYKLQHNYCESQLIYVMQVFVIHNYYVLQKPTSPIRPRSSKLHTKKINNK